MGRRLSFTHLQFEALLTAARQSPRPYDFALVAMLGLKACGSSRPPDQTSPTWVRNTTTGAARGGKGTKVVLIPPPPLSAGRSTRRSAPARVARFC
jgi:hypothetical protein